MAGKTNRWAAVPMATADPILGVAVAYTADPSPQKVNLGIGAYRDEHGNPLVLKCVREVPPTLTEPPWRGLAAKSRITLYRKTLCREKSSAIKEGRVAVCQSLSGTGALRIAGEFIALYNPGAVVYCSDPTWGNHHTIFQKSGLKTKKYRYLTPTMGLDIAGMLADLSAAPKGSVFVLHTVAHNPTGV
ncbi:pyridoxal phosphate-dependent transferase, partial [Baffinella frigidus]